MKNLLMVRLLMVALGIGTVLDFFMSMFGMTIVFNTNFALGYIICGAGAFAFIALKLSVEMIYSRLVSNLYRCMFFALWIVVFIDAYAVLNAIALYIVGKQPIGGNSTLYWTQAWLAGDLPAKTISIVLVVFLVAAPIAFSFLMQEYADEADTEYKEKK